MLIAQAACYAVNSTPCHWLASLAFTVAGTIMVDIVQPQTLVAFWLLWATSIDVRARPGKEPSLLLL